MAFGKIGNQTSSYARLTTAAQAKQLKTDTQKAEKVLAKFREVGEDLVSLNTTPADKLAQDPRKVVAQRGELRRPRFEKSSHQTAFQVARFLFPPLMLVSSDTLAKPSLSGVAELDEKSQPTSLNAQLSANRETGESALTLDYKIAEDGTEQYSLTSYSPVTVADAWEGSKPLGYVKHAVLPHTETVNVKDGELQYAEAGPRISSRATHLDLFERGYSVK